MKRKPAEGTCCCPSSAGSTRFSSLALCTSRLAITKGTPASNETTLDGNTPTWDEEPVESQSPLRGRSKAFQAAIDAKCSAGLPEEQRYPHAPRNDSAENPAGGVRTWGLASGITEARTGAGRGRATEAGRCNACRTIQWPMHRTMFYLKR